jgi:DNA-binding transcriptional regulator YiaG
MDTLSREELLEQVRSQRRLPRPAERRRIREEAGVSLRSVAAVLGVTHQAVQNWERGATPRDRAGDYARLLEDLRQATGDAA